MLRKWHLLEVVHVAVSICIPKVSPSVMHDGMDAYGLHDNRAIVEQTSYEWRVITSKYLLSNPRRVLLLQVGCPAVSLALALAKLE
eukprot:5679396-Amphidinium_carterae.1